MVSAVTVIELGTASSGGGRHAVARLVDGDLAATDGNAETFGCDGDL